MRLKITKTPNEDIVSTHCIRLREEIEMGLNTEAKGKLWLTLRLVFQGWWVKKLLV